MQQQNQTEEVYNDPGFRSEFTHIAKLWQSHIVRAEAFRQPSQLDEQSQFDFLSYDQIVNKSLLVQDNRDSCAAGLLRTALERAVAARYQLDEDRARRIVLAVLDRYLQEIYNISLYS